MNVLVRIQSISDIITNSSSELFAIIDDRPFEEVKRIIKEVGKSNLSSIHDGFSGEGGTLEVHNWEDLYNEWLKYWIPENKKSQATPEIWALQYKDSLEDLKKQILIKIDWSREHTIDWILENLWVIDVDCGYFEKDPETGRIIKRITYEEAFQLPKERVINNY